MEKKSYIKPQVEIIEVELQTAIMIGSPTGDLDTSDTNNGDFESNGGFWDTWNK